MRINDLKNSRQKFLSNFFQKVGRRRQHIMVLYFLTCLAASFLLPAVIPAAGQYKILSWKGDVRVKQGDTFIQLTKQSEISLKKGDSLWVEGSASIQLLFPDGSKQMFNGPCFKKVETLEKNKTKARPSFLANFIKITRIPELFFREKEAAAGTTKGDDFKSSLSFYKEIKKAIEEEFAEVKDNPPATGKEKEMSEGLAVVDNDFDAAPLEKQAIMKARIYKHFNQDRQAMMTVFNYYERILKAEGKQKEREFLEDCLFNEFLPVVVTYEVEEPSLLYGRELGTGARVSVRFVSNFKVWWAAFSFDGKEMKEIKKTIDSSLSPQETFTIRNHPTGNEKSKPYYLFIIANPVWSQLEKYDDIKVARKELLNEKIPETAFNKAKGFGRVTVKIDLSRVRRLIEEKMKRAAQISFFLVCLFFGICNL